ncbi:MFS transporter [Streptomyces sp. NPDC051954]|uniref:MFS transporter n=1 Tax=unclassified Streptomyces TaxID=2593676 RepID=UPI00343CBD81
MSLLTKALTVVVSAAFLVGCAADGDGTANSAAGGGTEKAQFSLPEPTGKYEVGTKEIHLVDKARQDPCKPDRKRETMINVWYPAKDADRFPRQPWISAGAQGAVEKMVGAAGVPKGSVDWAGAKTSGHVDAPQLDGKWPVVLYSPGLGGQRESGTVLVQDLASHGYVVVTMDHTYETTVEFPGGRVENPVHIPKDQLGKAAFAVLPLAAPLRQDAARPDDPDDDLPGLEPGRALRTRTFYVMTASFTAAATGIAALIVHMAPLLKHGGIEPTTAASVASLAGIGSLVGRLGVGSLIDRFFPTRTGVVLFVAASAGTLILTGPLSLAPVAVLLIGIAAGAESDMVAYLVGHYFGLRAYATVYAVGSAVFTFGVTLGPFAAAALILLGALGTALLPRERHWQPEPAQ